MQRGSRSSKNLLASSSSGWRKDTYKPDQCCWSVWHRHLQGLVRLPCCRTTAAGDSSSVFLLRESWLEGLEAQRNTGLPRTLCLQAYPLPPWVQQAHFKILQQSHQSTLWSVLPVQVWVPPFRLMRRWFIAWIEILSRIHTWEYVSRRLQLSETLAGSWAQQLQTAVTCTSSSLNASVTHLPVFHK